MTKQKSTPAHVTREILKEEISAPEQRLDAKIFGLDAKIDNVEKRLDAKIETTAQSYKDYTDHRFNQLDGKIVDVDSKVKGLDTKMTKYFELMMSTIINGTNEIRKVLTNHEQRITVVERNGPQADGV
jgi:hypothetical protein